MPSVIEILRAGTHTASNGRTVTFKPQDLEEIAASYNPSNFRAPLIVSHDTSSVEDKKLADTELAFGFPDRLEVSGDRLHAHFSKIAPDFTKNVREGRLMSVSPSFYLPDSPNNPTPGKLSLRHIAGLGASPPAIKGLAPLELSEMKWSAGEEKTINSQFLIHNSQFDEEGECNISLDFSEVFAPVGRGTVTALTCLRDWLISEKGLETADRVLGNNVIETVRTESERINQLPHIEMVSGTWEQLDKLEGKFADLSARFEEFLTSTSERISNSEFRISNFMEVNFMQHSVGGKLASLIADSDMDMTELAKAGSVTKTKLQAVVDGKGGTFNDSQLKGLATALGVNVADLVEDKEDKKVEMQENEQLVALKKELQLAKLESEKARQMMLEMHSSSKRKDLANFTEALVKEGRLLPAQSGDRVIDFGEGSEELTLVDFMMGLDERQLAFFQDYLATQPVQVDFSERVPPQAPRNGSEIGLMPPAGYAVSEESAQQHQEIVEYCQSNGLNWKDDKDYLQAAQSVLSIHNS